MWHADLHSSRPATPARRLRPGGPLVNNLPHMDESNKQIGAERLAQDILLSLRRIMRGMDISSRQLINQHGLTIPQLICLQHLLEQGALASGALANAIALSPATVTGILDRLELRGLVRRERRPEDKRHVLVTVTPAGRALATSAPAHLEKRLADALASLSEDRRREIQRTIQYLATLTETGTDAD